MGFFAQPLVFTSGGCGRLGGMNDQSGSYSAPAAIHCRNSSFCRSVSRLFDAGGGIRSPGSLAKIRATTSLESTSPGAMAPLLTATSRRSNRRSAFRAALSGPWQ